MAKLLLLLSFLLTSTNAFAQQRFDQLRDLIFNAEEDMAKYYDKNNQAAGKRVLVQLDKISELAQEIDREIAKADVERPTGQSQLPDVGYFNPFYLFRDILLNAEDDFVKYYDKNNKAAGTRVRKTMQDLKTLCQELTRSTNIQLRLYSTPNGEKVINILSKRLP